MRGWALVALLSGCIVGDSSVTELSPGVRSDPDQIPTNGLVLDTRLAATLSPAVPLTIARADGALDVNPEAAPGFLDIPEGRQLLEYVSICALRKDQTLMVGDVRAYGFYGLGAEWATGACDTSCQHWVTGCVLAHANKLGNPVQISLRGPDPRLQSVVTPEIESAFSRQEAAFYGTLGVDDNGRPQMFACMGREASSNAYAEAILGRICGLGQCGVRSIGSCPGYTTTGYDNVCGRDGGTGGYADCRDSLPNDPNVQTFHEAITVYTQPADPSPIPPGSIPEP
jgi:hypothetical protein